MGRMTSHIWIIMDMAEYMKWKIIPMFQTTKQNWYMDNYGYIYIYAYKYRCYIVSMVESWIWILDIVELEISIYI